MTLQYTPKTKQELIQLIDNNINLKLINTVNITDMCGLFSCKSVIYDITNWNVSNVIYMDEMFESAEFNQDISNWNVENVLSMRLMFHNSTFNQDISNWNVEKVENIFDIFVLSSYTYDIANWKLNCNCIINDIFNDISKLNKSQYKQFLNTKNEFKKYITYNTISTNVFSEIKKFKINNCSAIKKQITIFNWLYDIKLSEDILQKINNMPEIINYLYEDKEYYYFEYIESNNIDITKSEVIMFNTLFKLKYPLNDIDNDEIYYDIIPRNLVKSKKTNKIIMIDIKFILSYFIKLQYLKDIYENTISENT